MFCVKAGASMDDRKDPSSLLMAGAGKIPPPMVSTPSGLPPLGAGLGVGGPMGHLGLPPGVAAGMLGPHNPHGPSPGHPMASLGAMGALGAPMPGASLGGGKPGAMGQPPSPMFPPGFGSPHPGLKLPTGSPGQPLASIGGQLPPMGGMSPQLMAMAGHSPQPSPSPRGKATPPSQERLTPKAQAVSSASQQQQAAQQQQQQQQQHAAMQQNQFLRKYDTMLKLHR